MEFELFLAQKKIDALRFRTDDSALFLKWEQQFLETHPQSFVLQNKFLINAVRRKYTLTTT